MEDRYLFKAKQKNWRKLPKEQWWITGYYILGFNEYEEPVHMFFEPTSMFYSHGETDGWSEIDPSTICQCTGLKDMNGNLIWENDIVKGKYYDGGKAYEHMGQIKYDCQSYKVVGINQYKGYHAELDSLYETVGNIFDNPELLENEKMKQEKEEDDLEL